MKIVVWDTSSRTGAVAALELNSVTQSLKLVAELSLNVDLTHSERLLWGIHQVLEAACWKLPTIDYFGVGVGPGSFTGLRIGITTGRTLAHTLNKPLIAVSSLAALARPVSLQWPAQSQLIDPYVIASTDACKGELFALWGKASAIQKYASASEENLEVQEDVYLPRDLIHQVKEKLLQDPQASWTVVGEGRLRYSEVWKELPQDRRIPLHYEIMNDAVQGRFVGILACELIQAGRVGEGLTVHPRYLRASDAEVKLKAGLLKPASHRGES